MRHVVVFAATIALIFCVANGGAKRSLSRVVESLDRKKLSLVHTGEEGGAVYSVLSGDTIVVAEEPGLLLIKGGKVCRRILWQKAISNFDLNRYGNGVIVCDSILYKVKSLVIEPQPIPMSFANYLKGRAAYRVDMIGDTLVRVWTNAYDTIYVAYFDGLGPDSLTPVDEWLTRFVPGTSSTYIGLYDNEHYFFNFPGQPAHSSVRAIRFEAGRIIDDRTMDIGDIGRAPEFMWAPVKYEEETGHFYTMLSERGKLVIREFDIRDFTPLGMAPKIK